MSDINRINVYYTGTVQGVGFRFTAEKIALQLGVKGYVRNLNSGGVEAVCEGTRQDLERFMEMVSCDMEGYISTVNVKWGPGSGEFRNFSIRF